MQKIKTYGKRTFRLIPNTKSAASSTTPAAKWDLSDSDDSDGKEEIKIRAAPNVVVVHPEPVNSTSTVSPSRSSASQQQEGAVAVVDKEKKETSTEEEKEKREPEALQVSLLDDAQLPTRVSVCIDDLLLLSSRQQIISFEELYKDR